MPFQFSCLSSTERRSTAAKRDDLHSKLLFLVKKKDNGTQKAVQRQRMGILLCEQHFRDVWSRNESVQAEIDQILHTDTLTHAAKLVVRFTHNTASAEELGMVAGEGRNRANNNFKCQAMYRSSYSTAPWIVCRPHRA